MPKAALVHNATNNNELELNQSELIRTLEDLLEKKPDLIQQRHILLRSYLAAGQANNALREYLRILRESQPDDAFLEEAAAYFDHMGMDWEANNARARMQDRSTQPIFQLQQPPPNHH